MKAQPVGFTRLLVILLVVMGVSLDTAPGVAYAQSAAKSAESDSLEQITVTARRRVEQLQNVPVAETALNAGAIEARHIQSIAEITNYAPNIQFDSVASESGGGGASEISIRGIGQTDYTITVEPSVGLYLDGVYIGKSVGSLMDTVDLARIEVLRGPQGTLFGMNTIGGAILLTSKRPSRKPEFSIEATTGSYDRADVKASFGTPVNDRLRIRASGAVLTHNGYDKRILTGGHQGNKDALSGRFIAEFDVTDNLLATLGVDGSRTREESPAQITLAVDENAFFASLHNTIAYPACDPSSAGVARFSNTDCVNSQYVKPLDSYQTTNTGPNKSDSDIWGIHLTLDWTRDNMEVKSISAYRHTRVNVNQELVGIPTYMSNIGQNINLSQVSQELQLSGRALNSKLHYVAGLFYMNESGTEIFPVNLEPVQFTSGGAINNDHYAAYSQLTYDLTHAWSISAGVRYSVDTERFEPRQQIDTVPALYQPFWASFASLTGNTFLVQAGLPLFPRIWVSSTNSEVTPSATLTFHVTPEILTYFTYSKGFKGGGFTMRGFPPAIPGVTTTVTNPKALIPSFDPETADMFELGLKSELFDRRVRLNVAAFYTDYKDLQLTGNSGFSNFVPVLINAGDAHIKGVEVETEVVAADWLRLNGSVGYLDSKYHRISAEALAAGASLNNKIPNSPKWSASLGMTADLMKNQHGHVYLRADYAYKSSEYKTVDNFPALKQGAYNLVNASVTYDLPGDKWSITAGGTNLTNDAHLVSGVHNSGIGYAQGIVSAPREWFASIKYKL